MRLIRKRKKSDTGRRQKTNHHPRPQNPNPSLPPPTEQRRPQTPHLRRVALMRPALSRHGPRARFLDHHAFWIIAAGPHYFYFYFFPTETSGKLRGREHLVFQSKPAPLPPPPPHTLLTLVTHNLSLLQGGIGAARDLLISQHAPLAFLTSFCHSLLLLLLLDSQAPPASIHSDTHPHHHHHPPTSSSVCCEHKSSFRAD